MSKPAMKVIFGAMTIGKPGIEMTRIFTLEDTAAILDTFQKHGHKEIDTARVYGEGSSEEYLGNVGWQKRGLVMDTKLYPTSVSPYSKEIYSHSPADLRRGLLDSKAALKTDKLDTWYLHGPDRKTPLEDTLRAVNTLYQEGHFARFGISNFQTWEVARICELCDRHGWLKPTVYQGLYNALHRAVEPELFPCLRFYGLALYCFNPLAGGFLTSKFQRDTGDADVDKGGRFDPDRAQGKLHRGRYWNDLYFDALDTIRPVAAAHGISESDCALRWLAHHSLLRAELGDGIIVGASSTGHLEENLRALEAGPLPEEVVQAIDAGWARVRGKELKFWH